MPSTPNRKTSGPPSPSSGDRQGPYQRILIRSPNWLGDAVMATPAMQRLRAAHPHAHIGVLCPRKLAGLWSGQPFLDEILTIRSGETLWQVAQNLRAYQFDVGFLLPNSLRSALEVWLAGIPKRVGYRGRGRTSLLTDPVPPRDEAHPMRKRTRREIHQRLRNPPTAPLSPSPGAHHVYQYLHLVRWLNADPALVAPLIHVPPSELAATAPRADHGPPPLFGLNPGAEYGPAKRWPWPQMVETAARLREMMDCHWLVFGAPGDDLPRQVNDALQEKIGRQAVTNLAGQTDLQGLRAWLKRCELLITNDTGPMHLAAAVGTKVVALFGSTSPELTGPGGPHEPRHRIVRNSVPCSPCFRRTCPIDFRCMTSLSVDRVVQAALEAYRDDF